MSKASPINIFKYQDYRKFLRDWYDHAKKTRASVSFRSLSARGGLKSTNFLMLVMEGKRNLTEDSLQNVAQALQLNKQEKQFFKNLVLLTQAKTHEEKKSFYEELLKSKKFGELKPLEREQYEYYSQWYHPVVRELVVSKDFKGLEWIAQKIFPRITVAQVERSVCLLEKLGLIEKVSEQEWKQPSSIISTGAEVSSVVIHEYHKNLLELTKQVLDQVPSHQRDVSTMTLGVMKDRIPQLKKMIREFRQEVLKLVSVDVHPEEVVQLNIQMIPLTQISQETRS